MNWNPVYALLGLTAQLLGSALDAPPAGVPAWQPACISRPAAQLANPDSAAPSLSPEPIRQPAAMPAAQDARLQRSM